MNRLLMFPFGPGCFNYRRMGEKIVRRHYAIRSAGTNGEEVWVKMGDGKSYHVLSLYLRDNLELNSVTYDRTGIIDVLTCDEKALVAKSVDVVKDGKAVRVTWENGDNSIVEEDWFDIMFGNKNKQSVEKFIWDYEEILNHGIPRFDYNDVMHQKDALRDWVVSIEKYGFSFVDNVPVCPKETRKLSEKLGPTMNTIYGDFWDYVAEGNVNKEYENDAAYDNVPISLHTDATYMDMPSYIFTFHMLGHDGIGGILNIADGFKIIEQVKENYPYVYEYLKKHKSSFTYYSPDKHYLRAYGESIVERYGNLEMIRWNNLHRGPIDPNLSSDKIREYYEIHKIMTQEIAKEKYTFPVQMKPGSALFINNWRLLHGRTAFTGKRRMCGCYTPKEHFTSVLNSLLIPPTSVPYYY